MGSPHFNDVSRKWGRVHLMVVIAVIGILVLLALPKINGYIEKAELVRIQNDIRTME
jgi:type II secretory pathway pseudopilin PulG